MTSPSGSLMGSQPGSPRPGGEAGAVVDAGPVPNPLHIHIAPREMPETGPQDSSDERIDEVAAWVREKKVTRVEFRE